MGSTIILNLAIKEKIMVVKKILKKNSDKKMLEFVKQSLLDDKVINLKIIDIRKKSAFADFIIIGSGTSNRHIVTMAKRVKEELKKNFDFNASVEGIEQSSWVLIDASSIVVNIFRPEAREFSIAKTVLIVSKASFSLTEIDFWPLTHNAK